ncbi:MAG: UDP-N-acetylmuramoyl-L-alanyl-D-glutamate--2,6-diaminopimelate ligase [Clostridia bacterium]|nr:UDP-N-acetylmuramoyl-L-alanyl-D-glutamate--2,6-diaminopimelate ligase [Clostridia bacterium]
MRLSKLAETLEGEYVGGEAEIAALNVDSRKKVKNALFICVSGENVDSHELVAEAVRGGAVAFVTEKRLQVDLPQIVVKDSRAALGLVASAFYGNPARRLKMIGVTGTNGKTTTAHMLASILRATGKKVGIIGTLGVTYANKRLPANLTTPDPIELNEALADMLIHGVEYVVMEVSAHALYYKKIEGVTFVACIFTNLTQDHLDFFASMEEYAKAKQVLFSTKICDLAILNGDDKLGRQIGEAFEKEGGKSFYYGLETPSDCFAVITDESLDGTECMLNINDELCRVSLPLFGIYNVYNALAAASCATLLGVGKGVKKGLFALKSVCGRMERVSSLRGGEIFIDFAHTPDGLEKSLSALKKHCRGRLICVFGCGGNRDADKRPLMGETAAKNTHFSILTSDNPRYEDPLDIITEIEKGYRRFSTRYVIVPDRRKAIAYALETLQKEDVLLIAGKGGEEYQEVMGIKYPFNDYTVVEELLTNGKSAW